jgi:hypothetical protein
MRGFDAQMYMGMGAVTDQQIAGAVGSAGTSVISTMVLLGSISGPVGAAAAGIIAAGVALFNVLESAFSGCGQTCVAATTVVNQLEPLLQQNIDAYMSSPTHYYSMQQQALANFDTTWNRVVAGCSSPALGDAGVRCITDRQAGACKYKTSPGGWSNGVYTKPGQANSGSTCWNWFVGYRDPIANDPTVVPDPGTTSNPTPVTQTVQVGTNPTTGQPIYAQQVVSNTTTDLSAYVPLLMIGGLFLLAVIV